MYFSNETGELIFNSSFLKFLSNIVNNTLSNPNKTYIYIYIESTHRDLHNGLKILVNKFVIIFVHHFDLDELILCIYILLGLDTVLLTIFYKNIKKDEFKISS